MRRVVAVLVFFLALNHAAFAYLPADSRPMIGGERILPPYGLVDLCKRLPEQCQIRELSPYLPALTQESWLLIDTINRQINGRVKQLEDIDIYGVEELWTIPTLREGEIVGDCEDIALDKRRMLVRAGFPETSLIFAIARLPEGTLHTMLVVRTDRGDYVLDNLDDEVRPWQAKQGYVWIARQQEDSMLSWYSLY